MGNKRNIPASPKRKSHESRRAQGRHKPNDIKKGGNSIRIIPERRVKHGCCYDKERQKGFGAVLFTLGIPSLIAGIIMTIVSATDNEKDNKYPKAFIAVGPILLVLSIFFFLSGIFLHSSYVRKAFQDCFSLDDPKGFCRVRCPNLSQFLWPDDSIAINQAAIKALQSEPGKSVLKRNRFLSEPPENCSTFNFPNEQSPETDDVFDEENVNKIYNHAKIRLPRGVHFSDGDVEDPRRKRAGSNSSLLSLKHCKISPKDDIWWTNEHEKSKAIHASDVREESIQTTDL